MVSPPDPHNFKYNYVTQPSLTGLPSGPVSRDSLTTWNDSLLGYLNAVGTATNNLAQQLNKQEIQNSQLLDMIYLGIQQASSGLIQLFNSATAEAALWKDFAEGTNPITDATTFYNNPANSGVGTLKGDQAAVDALNTAINAYNTNGDASALQTAISAYNSYVNSASTSSYYSAAQVYNNAVNSNQSLVSQITPLNNYWAGQVPPSPNSLPTALGSVFASIPLSSLTGSYPPAPAIIPSPNAIGSVPTVTNIPTVTDLEYIQGATTAQVALIGQVINTAFAQFSLQQVIENSDFNALIDSTGNVTIPATYISNIPPIFFTSGQQLSLTRGATLASSLASGQNSPMMYAVTANSLFKEILTRRKLFAQNKANTLDDSVLVEGLATLSQNLLAKAAVKTGVPVSDLLSSSGLTNLEKNTAAFKIASTVSLTQSILATVSAKGADSVNAQVTALLKTMGYSADLAPDLTAALNYGLLTAGLLYNSLTLSLPGLTSQVLANATGVQTTASETPIIANQLLENPLSPVFLKMALWNQVQNQDQYSNNVEGAQIAINSAVNAALQNGASVSAEAFSANLQSQLIAQNAFDSNTIQGLAAIGGRFYKIEQSGQILDTPYQPLSSSQLSGQLSTGIQNQIAQNPAIQTALTATLSQGFQSNRQFLDALGNALVNGNAFATQDASWAFASGLVNQLLPTPIKAVERPLEGIGGAPTLTSPDLFHQLHKDVSNSLTGAPGLQNPGDLTNKIVAGVIGPNSLLGAINQQLTHLIRSGNEPAVLRVQDNVKLLATPTLSQYIWKGELNRIIKKQVAGYMDQARGNDLRNANIPAEPSNYIKNIDIRI